MRIALISFEYTGNVFGGGIGTYTRNLSEMLVGRGHEIEIFAAGDRSERQDVSASLRINFICCRDRSAFAELVGPVFLERHREKAFDVAEGPEYMCDTAAVAKANPDLPLVIKLHTPTSLIAQINARFLPATQKARFLIGSLRRGQMPKPYWKYARANDLELENLETATLVTSPCFAMARAMEPIWGIAAESIQIVPNVFRPPPELLEIPAETATENVSYIGRLELRKGVIGLARAIPYVLDSMPSARFRFIGRSLPFAERKVEMRDYLSDLLRGFESNVTFVEGLPYHAVLRYFGETDICVFPSIWENFPTVCLEAMSAARGIVGSARGGMAEMLSGDCGLIAAPESPKEIARSIAALLRDPERRSRMGLRAREKVLREYSWDTVGPAQEAVYSRAIQKKVERSKARLKSTSMAC